MSDYGRMKKFVHVRLFREHFREKILILKIHRILVNEEAINSAYTKVKLLKLSLFGYLLLYALFLEPDFSIP